ncbi:hypothetical protein V5799_012696 [Amblyomma americanum]|uniref:Uncharacterized protein n=1 Tax=Amblyomma americanum TaxID=6943 RepID=A0AAQ4E853_AMBAM
MELAWNFDAHGILMHCAFDAMKLAVDVCSGRLVLLASKVCALPNEVWCLCMQGTAAVHHLCAATIRL